jgi:hypothetical protein
MDSTHAPGATPTRVYGCTGRVVQVRRIADHLRAALDGERADPTPPTALEAPAPPVEADVEGWLGGPRRDPVAAQPVVAALDLSVRPPLLASPLLSSPAAPSRRPCRACAVRVLSAEC